MKNDKLISEEGFNTEKEIFNSNFETMISNPLLEIKNQDNIKIQKIIENLEKYDKKEFLQRLAALRLPYENRDKAVLLDATITATLNWLSENSWSYNGISMSYGKFKKVIKQINQLDSKMAIDPLNNPYIDNIQFYGNYKVMPGINSASSYNLKMIIQTIFLSNRVRLSDEKINYISILLNDNLNESTNVCNNCLTPYELPPFTRDIFIPSKAKLDSYMNLVLLFKELPGVQEISIMKNDIDLEKQKPFSQDQHLFLTKPYLDTGDGLLILDITSIANALSRKIATIISDLYIFDEMWNDIRKSLKRLNYKKIVEDNFSIKLLDERNYKEAILNIAEDKFLMVFGTFSGIEESNDYTEKITKRLDLIIEKLINYNIMIDKLNIIIVAQTLGGNIKISLKSNQVYRKVPTAFFNAMELKAISRVETDDLFLPRYMAAKMQLSEPRLIGGFGEGDFLPAIMFSENKLSFYFADDIDYREVSIHMGIEETSDYYLKALKKNEERLFYSMFNKNWYSSTKEEFSNRYFVNYASSKRLRCFIETMNGKIIEIITEKCEGSGESDILFNCIDLVSYWLDQYFSLTELSEDFVLYLCIEENPEKYFLLNDVNSKNPAINLSKAKNTIIWNITSQVYQRVGMENINYYERNLIDELISVLQTTDLDVLDRIFYPEYKKKMTGFLIDDNGKLRVPTQGFQLLKISEYEIGQLLDELGEYLKEKGYEKGAIPKKENSQFCNEIVSFLYSILEKEANVFNKNQLLNLLIAQIETLLPIQLSGESSYNNDIALSVQEKDCFFNQLNENNRNSIATKFLLEFIIASPITGKKNIRKWEIERLLAICSLIIEWAHRSDYFKYNFVDTTLNFLPSNRIGVKKEDFKDVNSAMLASRNLQLEKSKLPIFENKSYVGRVDQLFKSKLDSAFDEAFGYSFKEFNLVIEALIDLHNDLGKIVWVEDALVHKIFNHLGDKLSERTIESVLNSMVLEERESYLSPPVGFETLDVFPWRFNRRLSFIRKPIIKYESQYIFGIRNVIYAKKYLMRLIWTGSLKTDSKKMKDVMSKLRNILGDEFNNRVNNILETYPNLRVMKGVSKIGKKHISDVNNNTLGDIDVFVINRKQNKIFVIETKDFSFSRNPYELAMEQKKVFIGDKAFLSKHLKRSDWIHQNLDYVIDSYDLEKGNWEVVTMFVVSEHLITKDLVNTKGVKFLSLKELDYSKFH